MSLVRRVIRAYRNNGCTGVIRGGLHITVNSTNLGLPFVILMNRRGVSNCIKKVIEKGVGKPLDIDKLAKHKSSETLFIFGSGASINQISESEWEFISNHDSVGLNRWPIHDFVPTYHVFELPPGNQNELWRTQYWNLLDSKRGQYESTPLILKDITRVHTDLDPETIPDWILDDLYLSSDSNFPRINNTRERQRELLEYMRRTGFFDERSQKRPLYRKRGSISYLIHLGCILDYSNIVLCGVDMINSKYFFHERDRYEVDIEISELLPDRDPNDVHRTADDEKWRVTLDDIIYLLEDEVLRERGIALYVENSISKLHPRIDEFEYS